MRRLALQSEIDSSFSAHVHTMSAHLYVDTVLRPPLSGYYTGLEPGPKLLSVHIRIRLSDSLC